MPNLDKLGAASDVAFRSLFSLIFIVAGLGHFAQRDVMVARLAKAPLSFLATWVASPEVLITLTGVPLVAAGAALLAGYRTRVAAAVLLITLIPITIVTHLGNPGHVGPMFKNVALLGGLLHFLVRGGGAYSLDHRSTG